MHKKLTETLSKYQTIILVGGGTGGHIQPILSMAHELYDKELFWIGGENSHEEKEAIEAGVRFSPISTLKLTTTLSPKVLLYPLYLLKGIFQARNILRRVARGDTGLKEGIKNPSQNENIQDFSLSSPGVKSNTIPESDQAPGRKKYLSSLPVYHPSEHNLAVFSKGGPGSVAVGIAAWSLDIPLYIHESDTVPGRSNRILGKLATSIFLGFDMAKAYFDQSKCITIGQILHSVFENKKTSVGYIPKISWQTEKVHVLVICGSQGSKIIFEEIIQNLEKILFRYELIISLGHLNMDMRDVFQEKYNKISSLFFPSSPLHLVDWIDQENLAYLIHDADIAITRGSATTLAELTSLRSLPIAHSRSIKLIIIPLPYSAGNHQYWNAKEYEKKGDIILKQKNLKQLCSTLDTLGQNSPPSGI